MRCVTCLLAFVVGCAPMWSRPSTNGSFVPPVKAYVCVDLPPDQLPGARQAIVSWDKSLAQWKHLIVVDGIVEPCTFIVREVTDPYVSDTHALAWASMVGGREVSLMKGRYEQDVTGILLHELGHAFGAQHVPGTLMNPTWSPHEFTCPDATTVAQVAAWNRVDLGLLSWCY